MISKNDVQITREDYNVKSKIKLVIFDVDGTLTNGKIYMGNTGEEFKVFDIKDGCGIHDILPKHNITPIIMTARDSKIVVNRCKELNITHFYQGVRDKETKLKELVTEFGLEANYDGIYENVAYVGDDIIDIPCMKLCGIVGCPADAISEVKKIAHFISTKNGGEGAVREFIEWIVQTD